MGWKDNLRRVTLPDGRRLIGASFRGIPFFVVSHGRTGGRRTVNNEFPERDLNFVEDLGRKGRTFPVEGYVIGDDYAEQADKLISALEDVEGPGELIHPRYGNRRCICDDATVSESNEEGRMARFSIKFIEAPAQSITPTIEPEFADQVDETATATAASSKQEFEAAYDVVGLPGFALVSAETAIRSMSAAVGAAFAPIVKTTDELAKLTGQLDVITDEASSLARQPTEILTAFSDAVTGLAETAAAAPLELLNALLEAYDVDMGPAAPETTATRQRERANQLALTGALRQIMVIEAARLAPTVAFKSIDDATASRDAIAGRLDAEAAAAGDTAYPALVELRAAVLRAVPGDRVFARIITVSRPVAIPSLLLSYQLYGSVDQEQDLIDRNDIRHPGFVSGDIRALSNV